MAEEKESADLNNHTEPTNDADGTNDDEETIGIAKNHEHTLCVCLCLYNKGTKDAGGKKETSKVFEDVWKAKPLVHRILLIVVLWTAYAAVVVTDAVYANSIGMFVNVPTATLLHDVIPAQYVIILQTMVGVWQLFFLVYQTLATLTRLKLVELPLPVIPLYISALLINLGVTLVMYLGSDLAVILLASLISGILNVAVFLTIRATYTSPIPILPLCCYNPQVLYSTFMTYTSLYHICHYVSTYGHDTQTINVAMTSIFLSVVIVLSAFDIIVLDKWMQRTWSPYISSIISTVYLATHNWGKGDVSVYLFVACTVILSIGLLIKLIRSAQLTFEKPCRKCYEYYKQSLIVEPDGDEDEEVVAVDGELRVNEVVA